MKLSDYLDIAAKHTGSDRQTALRINVTPQYISKARAGGSFSDEAVVKLAEIVKIDVAEIFLAVHAERSHRVEIKTAVDKFIKKATGRAAAVMLIMSGLLICLTMVTPIPTQANAKNDVYYVKYWIRSSARPDLCNLTKPGTLPRQTMAR